MFLNPETLTQTESRTSNSVDRIRTLVEPLVQELGLELWDLVLSGDPSSSARLSIFVERADGTVDLADCAVLSKKLSVILDVEDPIAGAFHLEVSSPGLGRTLRTNEHFERFIGSRVKIRLSEPVDGRRNVVGVLESVHGDEITMDTEDGSSITFQQQQIRRANLVVDISFTGKR